MKPQLAAGCLILICLSSATSALAHGRERVRRELSRQGYEQIEISGKSSPFDVFACRNGERLKLHVDYYGKLTEESVVGVCESEVRQPAETKSPPPAHRVTSPASGCMRYVASIGKAVAVPCP